MAYCTLCIRLGCEFEVPEESLGILVVILVLITYENYRILQIKSFKKQYLAVKN